MVYNSIVTLRQRVRQAWANVDVQLKRRHDLIPNLVTIVQGMRNYEQTLQRELAELRNQLVATPPGEPGPDPQAVATIFGAIQERYPELKANRSFLHLQQKPNHHLTLGYRELDRPPHPSNFPSRRGA